MMVSVPNVVCDARLREGGLEPPALVVAGGILGDCRLNENGSQAAFFSYTFFRPGKIARLIAARTGQAIQKA